MRQRWLQIGALMLLCLLWAIGWVHADLFPRSTAGLRLTPLLEEAAQLGAFAVMAAVAAVIWRQGRPVKGRLGRAALVGFGLFIVPAVLTEMTKERIDNITRVALFSLVPLFAVIFEPYLGVGNEHDLESRAGFSAAMLALAGTLLVFPVELPHSYASGFALLGLIGAAASVAAANCLGVGIVRQGGSALTFAAVATGSAACLMGMPALLFRANEASAVSFNAWEVPDLLALVLLFWLMRHMSAVQMTTRFLIAPLLANLIGLAFLRPHVQFQAWVGLLLIAAGAGWMLFARADRGERSATTLHLD